MNNSIKRSFAGLLPLLALVAIIFSAAATASAASWNGIEPYKSKRAEVEKILGPPESDQIGVDGSLRFHVAGGTAIVSFVDAKFASAKKLSSDKIGTVKEVVLQHEAGTDSPESLKLKGNSSFQREENKGVEVYRNLKEGLAYTFIDGKLRTTYYFPGGGKFSKGQTFPVLF